MASYDRADTKEEGHRNHETDDPLRSVMNHITLRWYTPLPQITNRSRATGFSIDFWGSLYIYTYILIIE